MQFCTILRSSWPLNPRWPPTPYWIFIKIDIFVTVMTITTNEVSICTISLMLNLLDEVLNYFEVVLTSKSKMAADTILKFIKIDIFVITMTITTNEVSICTKFLMLNLLHEVLKYFRVILNSKIYQSLPLTPYWN